MWCVSPVKTILSFICKWLLTGDGFWLTDGSMSTPPFTSQTPYGPGPCSPCSCCLSLHEFICTAIMICLGSFVLSIPYDSSILSASSSTEFPESWGEEFDRGISFRARFTQVFHSLRIIWLSVSVFVFTCSRKKHFWRWQSKAWINGYRRKPREVILLSCYFGRMIVFAFSLGSWDI